MCELLAYGTCGGHLLTQCLGSTTPYLWCYKGHEPMGLWIWHSSPLPYNMNTDPSSIYIISLEFFSMTNTQLWGLKGTCNKIKEFNNISPLVSEVLWHTWLVQHCSYKMLQLLPTLRNSWTCNMLSQELCTCTTSPPQPRDERVNKKWPEDYKHARSWRQIREWPPHWVSTVLPHL